MGRIDIVHLRNGSAILFTALFSAWNSSALSHTVQFNRDIRPILADKCFACHGPDANARKANFRLDVRDSALARKALVPGEPAKSLVLQRILSRNPATVMPPASFHKKLTAAQKETIRRWIKEGAKYESHWAYIPPSRPPIPIFRGARGLNPIDAFIRRELTRQGLNPSPEADRRTMIRRVTLDVTGIPPTLEEYRVALADASPNWYEKVVDRLLASPRYGERMAAPWLDIVRYSDTVGFHGDQNQNAWAYRDYVVKSFNVDKPFDRFTVEQIAGDLLPKPSPETLTATCFNRLNMVTREGGAQPKEYLAKYAADRVRTVGMAWMGSTFACAECHDHKYDPISQRDFYSLAAFFADLKQWGVYADYAYTPNPDLRGIGNDHPFPPEIKVESPYLQQRIQRNLSRISEIAELYRKRLDADAGVRASYAQWRNEASAFVSKHKDGWETAASEVLTAAGKPAESKPFGAPQPDGSLLLTSDAPSDPMVGAKIGPGWVSTVRIELLPHSAHGGSILRQGTGGTLRAALSLRGPDGKSRPIPIRYAGANYALGRFANSFEIIGIQGGWSLDSGKAREPHLSLWLLDRPLRVESGASLGVTLRGAFVGCVRISVSPLAPAKPDDLELNRAALNDLAGDASPSIAGAEAFIRGTGSPADAYNAVKTLDADILSCRRGITPVMVTESIKPVAVRVLPRGNWQDESGAVVEPAIPHFLPQDTVPKGARLSRLDLANWLVSPENPLTARMFVNRLWRQFFGTAISDKVEDLGTQGEWPTHPELLDWLALEFMRPGSASRAWTIKRIVRLIVTSATYRQSSRPRPDVAKVDPQNRLLARQNPRRLEAEFVRDNALSIAGLLNLDIGGPPVMPYQPPDYYANLQFPDRDYIASPDDRQWRRGVYTHWQRTFLHPMLANFDAPSREDCIAARTVANTPQQALTLLNDPAFIEAARTFAARLVGEVISDSDRLERAYQAALGRGIKPAERASLVTFLGRVREEYKKTPEDAKKLLSVGNMPPPTGDPVELAAWTSVARVILNLHETITRY